MIVGDVLQIEILRIREDGQGVGFTPDGKMVLIEGVTDDDQTIKAKITTVLEETLMAKKIGRLKSETKSRKGLVENPYALDDDEDDDDDED